ncbi:MAG TPA: CpsD/CapB family tyrosine-protein kinase [Terriglobia bacterium]|nr:CpsD/CapB family tyrosine-protein kinase [Terriglobia bacterium]
MSRIHDALKKAEQERLAQGLPPETTRVETPPAPEPARPELVPVPSNGDAVATEKSPAKPKESPVETLLATCQCRDTKAGSGIQPESDAHRDPLVSEEFRSLRSLLYLTRKRQALRKLLITSPLPKEGKTFLAANLAQTFARQSGSRVLLIDCDLRISALHKILGVPQSPGLSEYLSGAVELGSALQRGAPDNLFFMTGGERSANPTELLGNGRFEQIMNRIGPAFDWIILDSPPAVPVSDSRLLAQFCDGVLMLVQAGVTPFDMAQKACQEFPKSQLLGVVLNRAQTHSAGSYQHYYSERGQEKL